MNYTTHNEDNTIDTNGTSLQGHIQANYADLVQAFGEPTNGDEYKVDAEWNIVFSDGTRASVYNWKDGINYCGESGTPTEQITDWHIGGFNQDSVYRVSGVLSLIKELA
jgi:hypothetical protein